MSEERDLSAGQTTAVLEQLGRLTVTLGLLGAFLSYAGYELLSSYFREFKIHLWLLDLPAYTYPMASRTPTILVLSAVVLWLPFILVLHRLLLFASRKLLGTAPHSVLKAKPFNPVEIAAFVVLLFFVIGFLSYQVGNWRADKDVQSDSTIVNLTFKPSATGTPRDERLLKANTGGRLRMLTQTKDLVIVYEKTSKAKVTTYVIARSEISSVRSSDIEVIE